MTKAGQLAGQAERSTPARAPGMKLPIYLITGAKGGVGKSLMALTLIDELLRSNTPTLFIETDAECPDVYRCLRKDWSSHSASEGGIPGVVLATCRLTEREGWVDLIDMLAEHHECCAVINTPPRLREALLTHGVLLRDSLAELQRCLVTLWLLDRHQQSVERLEEYLGAFPNTVVHAVRNGMFGDEESFGHYNDSDVRSRLEVAGGKSLILPEMARAAVDAVYNHRLTISEALEQLTLGERAALRSWREAAHEQFNQVVL